VRVLQTALARTAGLMAAAALAALVLLGLIPAVVAELPAYAGVQLPSAMASLNATQLKALITAAILVILSALLVLGLKPAPVQTVYVDNRGQCLIPN